MHERGTDGAERLMLPDSAAQGGQIPNNARLPVLLHRGATPPGDPAAAEALFARHGWPPAWRNGIYDFDHYHPNAHEALAIARGHVRVRLGAEAGVTLDLAAGDVVVLPAGTAHRNSASPTTCWWSAPTRPATHPSSSPPAPASVSAPCTPFPPRPTRPATR